MADTANSVIKSKFIARYGPMRAGFGILQDSSTSANAGKQNRFWTDIDGTQRPMDTDNVLTFTTTPFTLKPADSGSKVIYNSTTSLVGNLPAKAVGLSFRVFVKVAASSGLGHIIHQAAADSASIMYTKGLASTAGKGLTNTQATGAMGDNITVWCDGTDWYATSESGTWAREA